MPTSLLELTPVRASVSDDPADILRFAIEALKIGRVALATLTEVRGGAARALGSQVVVAEDGRFCGYVSGGCVEAAVASEALLAMAGGRDREIRFGEGSPFFDIVLPCGGGIVVTVHLLTDAAPLRSVLSRLERRQPAGLGYFPIGQRLVATAAAARSGWYGDEFVTVFRPLTRVAISGHGAEAASVRRVAESCGYHSADLSNGAGELSAIDEYTAVVILHHDLEAEGKALKTALRSEAFYIGALGSTRTHRRRVERLQSEGFAKQVIGRIKAPIGTFGPTRESTSLALSVLSDIAACRLATFG
jgi:xanthine dehydrogenase accessory factor